MEIGDFCEKARLFVVTLADKNGMVSGGLLQPSCYYLTNKPKGVALWPDQVRLCALL